MYLDEIEEQTIRRWIEFIKNCPLLQDSVSNEVPVSLGGNKYRLSKYNAVQSSIEINNPSVDLVSYMPFDAVNQKQICDIIVNNNTQFTVNYKYNPFAILSKNKKPIGESVYETPRLHILWSNSTRLPIARQVNDNGELVAPRRGYLTIIIDVDETRGGYSLQSQLTGKVLAAIEGYRDELNRLGFEDAGVQQIPYNEKYTSETPVGISRGVLMIAFTIYPKLRR